MSLKLLMILIRAEGRLRVIRGRWMFLISYCRVERLQRHRGHHMLRKLILIQLEVRLIMEVVGGFLMVAMIKSLMLMGPVHFGICRLIGLIIMMLI